MAKILDSMANFFGFSKVDQDFDDYDDEVSNEFAIRTRAKDYEQQEVRSNQRPAEQDRFSDGPRGRKINKPLSAEQQSNKPDVICLCPKNVKEVQEMIEKLRNNSTVLFNLEEVDIEIGRRILDLMTGASAALDAEVNKVSKKIYLASPKTTRVSNSCEVDEHDTFSSKRTEKDSYPY